MKSYSIVVELIVVAFLATTLQAQEPDAHRPEAYPVDPPMPAYNLPDVLRMFDVNEL